MSVVESYSEYRELEEEARFVYDLSASSDVLLHCGGLLLMRALWSKVGAWMRRGWLISGIRLPGSEDAFCFGVRGMNTDAQYDISHCDI